MKEPVKIDPLENISLVELLMWQKPSQGPPLPVFLNVRWPWKGEKPLKTWLGGVYIAPQPEEDVFDLFRSIKVEKK